MRSCYFIISVMAVLFSIALYVVRVETKASWYQQGRSDAEIDSKVAFVEKIKKFVGSTEFCKDDINGYKSLLNVKTTDLYIKKHGDGRVSFCVWE